MADWQAIRSEYEQGASLRQLATKHGIGKSTIAERKFKEQWDKPDTGHNKPDTSQAPVNDHPTPEKELTTEERKLLFLDNFARHAIVTHAARESGIDRSTVYDWLEHDEEFSFAFNQAKEAAKDEIRAEIRRRGAEGYYEQVIVGGQVHTIRKYSDTLLIFHAKMLMPEYREKSTVDVNTTNKTVEIYRVRIPHNDRD